MDDTRRFDRGREEEAHTEFVKLNGDDRRGLRTRSCRRDDWIREFSTREKTRFVPAHGHKIRLRQNLQQVPALQQTQRCAKAEVRTKQEQIQGIAYSDLLISQYRPAVWVTRKLQRTEAWKRELLRRGSADQLVIHAEEIYA